MISFLYNLHCIPFLHSYFSQFFKYGQTTKKHLSLLSSTSSCLPCNSTLCIQYCIFSLYLVKLYVIYLYNHYPRSFLFPQTTALLPYIKMDTSRPVHCNLAHSSCTISHLIVTAILQKHTTSFVTQQIWVTKVQNKTIIYRSFTICNPFIILKYIQNYPRSLPPIHTQPKLSFLSQTHGSLP